MTRALFVEYPDDPGSWLVEDEYLLGSDLLVAPLLETGMTGRAVYLPPGKWIDYQTAKVYAGGWQQIAAGALPVVVLVRDGAVLPHAKLAQTTSQIDWSALELVVYADGASEAKGLVALPGDGALQRLSLLRKGGAFALANDPLVGKVRWTVRRAAAAAPPQP
jgi:alpha-D-xyloside xylohydrolase